VVEPGPPPILTKQGVVLIYNGADNKLVYRAGVAILDLHDPRRVIYRSDMPIFSPERESEKVGQVPTSCLSKAWSVRRIAGYFITVARIGMWELRKRRHNNPVGTLAVMPGGACYGLCAVDFTGVPEPSRSR